ncbi:BatD family protein [Rufibacter ruber]|uniref:BatD family protein n=1 Tax=Rufibacter ruber TaxID=1783499 RepID=UPI000829F4D4|nr:BatD family protein [Rufibacter ruber]
MKKRIGILWCLWWWVQVGWAQGLSIEYGPTVLPLDQYFTVSLKAAAKRPEKVEGFPEIEGMQKSAQRVSSSTYRTGAKTTVVYTITQQYAPLREGEFTVKPFTLQVDGKSVAAAGVKGRIKSAAAPDQDTLAPAPVVASAPEFIEVRESAFLTLHLPKERVYVGESVPVSLWFYVADTDLNLVDFYEFEPQILEITRLLKQRSTLEQVLEQQEIKPEKIKVGEKSFTRYKLHEAVLFPITAQPLKFPAVGLRMVKYKIAQNPSLLGQNRLPEYKTYSTSEKTVTVRPLPPHPLRDQVAVGVFRLREQLSRNTVSLNQNLVYQMQIEGEGNISALPMPQSKWVSSTLEIYPPEVRQQVRLQEGRIWGSKTFRYFMVGRQAGEYPLREHFQWVYFNLQTARYDTLRPSVKVKIRGQEDQNAFIRAQDAGNFYKIIDTESNQLIGLDQFKEIRRYTNVVLAVMGVVALILFIFQRNE